MLATQTQLASSPPNVKLFSQARAAATFKPLKSHAASSRPGKPYSMSTVTTAPCERQLAHSQLAHSHSEPNFVNPKFGHHRKLPSTSSIPVFSLALSHHVWKTVLWVSLALSVAASLAIMRGRQRALEFLTGYIVEYSLSVDNLFVFLLIFKFFRVPRESQETVLSYGILGAMLLRGVMIASGKALVERFEWIALLFAALLIYSAGKMLLEDDESDENLDDNRVIRFAKNVLPVSDHYSGTRFFVRENSRWLATPLMVVLVSIELSDVIFALDSVPAVLGISNDTFVIYTSNILAIMGLRSLFFVLSASMANLRFLKHALAIVLGFIGIKMIAGCLGFNVSTALSLGVVVLTLVGGILLSMALPAPLRAPSGDSEETGVDSV